MLTLGRFTFVATVVVASLVADITYASTQPDCAAQDPAAAFPIAARAIETWAAAREIFVPRSIRDEVMADFCAAAESLAVEKGLALKAIDQEAEATITEYLNRTSDSRKKGQRLISILRSQFGVPGFARPQEKRYGIVRITYNNAVDSLQIGSQILEPWPALMMDVGEVRLIGLLQTREVCRIELKVTAAAEALVTC